MVRRQPTDLLSVEAGHAEGKRADGHVVVGRDGTGLRRLSDEEAQSSPPALGDISRDRRLAAYALNRRDLRLREHYQSGPPADPHRGTGAESRLHARWESIVPARRQSLRDDPSGNGSLVQMTHIRSLRRLPPSHCNRRPAEDADGQGGRGATMAARRRAPRGTDSQES